MKHRPTLCLRGSVRGRERPRPEGHCCRRPRRGLTTGYHAGSSEEPRTLPRKPHPHQGLWCARRVAHSRSARPRRRGRGPAPVEARPRGRPNTDNSHFQRERKTPYSLNGVWGTGHRRTRRVGARDPVVPRSTGIAQLARAVEWPSVSGRRYGLALRQYGWAVAVDMAVGERRGAVAGTVARAKRTGQAERNGLRTFRRSAAIEGRAREDARLAGSAVLRSVAMHVGTGARMLRVEA
jgi:hypothetical protein